MEFYRTTKIKFARREGGISFAANDKNFIRKDRCGLACEMKFKDHASYARRSMYTARSFNKRR
ncbi:hypothetical protein [uncultured Campylobacter sp.]|uniref:hypothetical protein n=1 Tax=uncultured Campylobacter sp. TaxID=218934 RepID=UPI00262A7429|nr:hypothetical protein [uncultured Campylobacter sp.]